MLKIDVISGFLGAGKTTFIKRLLDTNLKDEKVVLIENEYGEVSVDSEILTDSKIEIKELSQGCICCSLVGDFSKSLKEIVDTYNPDRILIEPSGVGKLSDVINAISSVGLEDHINSLVCMVDAKKARMYDKNFGEFFTDQIKNAHTVILSRMDITKEENAKTALEIVRKHNDKCVVVSTPIKDLSDEEILKAYEGFDVDILTHEEECCCGHHHEHHHHHDEEECCCGHHHEHHHHHDEEECCCGHHHEHHHHHDEEECCCGHHHEHHHHHHADEVFTSIGIETVKKYDIDNLTLILNDMANGKYGLIVRAKGIIQGTDMKWYMFNLTPEEVEVEPRNAIATGKIVVIGSHINEEDIKKLF
ncbi:MAG: hypothetical protein E7176_01235 [Erysipelotrichaceae bacterium]|nr:hypothetical protein [Erysipelotrichaceae bacterium]